MNAVVFYAMGQKFLANRICRIIAEVGDIVYCRKVEINNTKCRLEREEIQSIKEYIGYLNAARRKPDQTYFLPNIENEYVRYIMVRYLNYTAVTLDLELTDKLLPAVALDNRMVVMPQTVLNMLKWNDQGILKGKEEDSYFGICEADFLSEETLRGCFREKIDESMASIQTGISNYLHFHGGIASIERIAEAMDITVACAQMIMNRIAGRKAGKIVGGFCCSTMKAEEWQVANLCITNNGETDVEFTGIEIEGPVEMRKTIISGRLAASQSLLLPLQIKPIEKGQFPLDIRIRLNDFNRSNSVGVDWVTIT